MTPTAPQPIGVQFSIAAAGQKPITFSMIIPPAEWQAIQAASPGAVMMLMEQAIAPFLTALRQPATKHS